MKEEWARDGPDSKTQTYRTHLPILSSVHSSIMKLKRNLWTFPGQFSFSKVTVSYTLKIRSWSFQPLFISDFQRESLNVQTVYLPKHTLSPFQIAFCFSSWFSIPYYFCLKYYSPQDLFLLVLLLSILESASNCCLPDHEHLKRIRVKAWIWQEHQRDTKPLTPLWVLAANLEG